MSVNSFFTEMAKSNGFEGQTLGISKGQLILEKKTARTIANLWGLFSSKPSSVDISSSVLQAIIDHESGLKTFSPAQLQNIQSNLVKANEQFKAAETEKTALQIDKFFQTAINKLEGYKAASIPENKPSRRSIISSIATSLSYVTTKPLYALYCYGVSKLSRSPTNPTPVKQEVRSPESAEQPKKGILKKTPGEGDISKKVTFEGDAVAPEIKSEVIAPEVDPLASLLIEDDVKKPKVDNDGVKKSQSWFSLVKRAWNYYFPAPAPVSLPASSPLFKDYDVDVDKWEDDLKEAHKNPSPIVEKKQSVPAPAPVRETLKIEEPSVEDPEDQEMELPKDMKGAIPLIDLKKNPEGLDGFVMINDSQKGRLLMESFPKLID